MLLGKTDRELPLETLRGMAALSVVLWHAMLGFFPENAGIFSNFPNEQSLRGSLLYSILNGAAAVAFFFVLSGFVLTRRFFIDGDRRFLLRNALKRWPRLALPVTFVVVGSWALFAVNAYHFEAAATITKSPWLAKFAYAYEKPFEPSLVDALRQGLYRTFFFGESYYNSSLWTMRYEFIGSFIAFGFAALIGHHANNLIIGFLAAVVAGLIAANASPWYFLFVVGVVLASILTERIGILPLWAAIAGIALSFYFAGYSAAADQGVFWPITAVFGQLDKIYVWAAASTILIASALLNEKLRSLLANRLGAFLGWISFPLYLVHIPILCSAGCAALLYLEARLAAPWPQIMASVTTIVLSVMASIPLAHVNDRWVAFLNAVLDTGINKR